MEILWYSLPLMHYKRNEKFNNSRYKLMDRVFTATKAYQIYNKSFQYNGTGQTFLKVLRSKNTRIYPSFQTTTTKNKIKQKQKKEIFLFRIVWLVNK